TPAARSPHTTPARPPPPTQTPPLSLHDALPILKGADKLILATDPDREGEAISWHILEVLKEKKLLKDLPIERVAFNAITKSAVRSEEHTSELQSRENLVCRLLLEKKKKKYRNHE